jgi:hypothetical protein
MGEKLAEKIRRDHKDLQIDVVIPIPDSSRPSALQLAMSLGVPYREGFVKNRYIGRTFIMPGQAMRKRSVRQKLNVIAMEFKGKNVLLVDDSIVRGTTSREIVQMARESGRAQGVLRHRRAAGALPERLRHRHADARRAGRRAPQRGRGRRRDRRRRAHLPGPGGAQRGGARGQSQARQFRGLVLRRLLRHRRRHGDYLHVVETRRDAQRDTDDDEGAQLDLNLVANG